MIYLNRKDTMRGSNVMKKNMKIFTMIFVLMFVFMIKVNAEEEKITTWNDLKLCLTKEGTATCETDGKITAVAENITVVGDKTLILGDTLTITNRFKLDNSSKLTVNGNVTTTGQFMFMVEAGSSLVLESGLYTSTLRAAKSENTAVIVSAFGASTSGANKTFIEINKNVEFKDGGIAIYPDRATGKAAYGVELDFHGKISMTKNNDVTYNVFTILGTIKAKNGEDLPTINIYEGSSITNDDAPAIYAAGYGIWNIKGGTFTGSEALSIKAGQFNITGGTFIANGEYVDPESIQAQNSASEKTGSAISITGNDGYAAGVELNIENAVVESKNGYAIFEGITKGVTPAVKGMKVYSGEYAGKVSAVYTENIEEFIAGGIFNSELNKEYLVNDIKLEKTNDGTFVAKNYYLIYIDSEIKNGTVSTVEKAYSGDLVKLDINPNKGYKVAKIEVLDHLDRSIEVKDNSFTMPTSPVMVKVTFEKDEKVPETGDSIITFIIISLICLLTSITAINKLRKDV